MRARRGRWRCGSSSIGGLVYLFVPLITIAVFTFNDPTSKFNTSWEGFTFDNWLHPFSQEAFTDALSRASRWRSSRAPWPPILGSLIALALARYRIHGSAAINLLIVLPLTTPEIVMGASLFTLFFNQGVEPGLLDDRDRPHAVLPELRGADRQGPDPRHRLDARGRGDGPRLAADAHVLEDHDADHHARRRRPRSCCRWR